MLDFLLAADFPGAKKLREQAKSLEVTATWDPCCPTIEFAVEGDATPFLHEVPLQAIPRNPDDPFELLVHVDQFGRLRELELVHHGDEPAPTEFPPPDFWSAPWWNTETYPDEHKLL